MYTLFDGIGHVSLKPLTYTRPVAEIRVGIFSLREKWEKHLDDECRVRTKDYLTEKYNGNDLAGSLGIAATVLPNTKLVQAIKKLEINQLLIKDGTVIAINELPEVNVDFDQYLDGFEMIEYTDEISFLINPCDIFSLNGKELEADFRLLNVDNRKKNLDIEQNNQVTRDRFINQVAPRLALIQAQQGIESFRIVMDDTNNTELDKENNRLNGKIIVVPTRTIEFISIDFIITNAGVSFE